MKRTYYELVVRDPGAVAWYCAVKLEMAVALTAALLTQQLQSDDVPGLADAQRKIEAELVSRTGLAISVDGALDVRHFGQVDESYATFEWSEGASSTFTWPSGWSAPHASIRSRCLVSRSWEQAASRSTPRYRVSMLCRRQRLRTACPRFGTAPTPSTT